MTRRAGEGQGQAPAFALPWENPMREKARILLTSFEKWLSYFFFVVMALAVLLQLFSRLLYHPLSWGEEVARYSYIWLAFIGAAYSTMTKDHIQISYFVKKFSNRTQRMIQIVLNIAIIVCLVWTLPSAFSHSVEQYNNLSPALEIPTFYVYIAFPIGMVLIILRLVQLVISDICSFKTAG